MRELQGDLVLDASVLIEMAYDTKIGQAMKVVLEKEHSRAWTTQLSLTELFYILCRELGVETTIQKIDDLLSSNYVTVSQPTPVVYRAGEIKCERAISLADCYAIALAGDVGGKAVFAKEEKEISIEISKRPFDEELVFMDELFELQDRAEVE